MVSESKEFDAYFQEHRERHLKELFEFIRIPSVSLHPEYKDDVLRAVEWALICLKNAGIQTTSVLETDGHPAAYGELIYDESLPTILIYGHLDVVEPGDEKLWYYPPFEPILADGKIFARGSSDDKGCLFIPIKTVEAFLALKSKLPFNIKFLLEGEEELLSPNLSALLTKNKDLLKCDVILSADNCMYETGNPSMTMGVRGFCSLEIDISGPAFDLHSGLYGGAFRNPLIALSEILSGFHTPDGKVTITGFYDDVRNLTSEERSEIATLPFDETKFLKEAGASNAEILHGERGYSTLERIWSRPTLEVCGISGGYQGQGTKNIVPSRGHAKISCRLVPNQDPVKILNLVEKYIREKTPAGMTIKVTHHEGRGYPYEVPRTHAVIKASVDALREAWNAEPQFCRCGGTIPMAALGPSILGAPYFQFSFQEPDNQMHAPNEFFRIENFDRGLRAHVKLFQSLESCFKNIM